MKGSGSYPTRFLIQFLALRKVKFRMYFNFKIFLHGYRDEGRSAYVCVRVCVCIPLNTSTHAPSYKLM